MYDPLYSAYVAQERYDDMVRQAARRRLAARVRPPALALSRRAARPLGRALLRLGAGLLRYGQVEQPAATRPYRPPVRSVELN
jgi:hypothetical protein